MAKYRTYERQRSPHRRKEPHPIWRGLGCLMMLVIPALAYGISFILIDKVPAFAAIIPPGLLGRPAIPLLLYQVPGLIPILDWIQSIHNLYALLLGTFSISILLAAVFALLYAILYRVVGPPRYSGYDVPPPNIKVKKYKR